MTLAEKLARAKLINKYTIERDNHEAAASRTSNFRTFNASKAAEFQAKLDALNAPKESS